MDLASSVNILNTAFMYPPPPPHPEPSFPTLTPIIFIYIDLHKENHLDLW